MKKIYRIGTAGLLSDLPLHVALAQGFFAAEGLQVELTHELGWASIESHFETGALDAANVPTVMPVAVSAGLGKLHRLLKAFAITSLHSESLTLNTDVANAVVNRTLAPGTTLRIGVESPYSSGNFFAEQWLRHSGSSSQMKLSLVPLSVSQLFDLLGDGYIQGVYGSEPLGFEIARASLGTTVARSRDAFTAQAQSVLVGTAGFATNSPQVVRGLSNAVERARQYCANRDNHIEIFADHYLQIGAAHAPRTVTSVPPPAPAPLSTLILFGPEAPFATGSQRELLEFSVRACLALPGAQELRQEIRDVFPSVFELLLKSKA